MNDERARKARITAKFGVEAACEAIGAIFKHIPQKQHLFDAKTSYIHKHANKQLLVR
jgi:hypothetical protein